MKHLFARFCMMNTAVHPHASDNDVVRDLPSIYDSHALKHPREIRLIKLAYASDLGASLQGELCVVHLDEAAASYSFAALSYTWRPPFSYQMIPDRSISIGRQMLSITGNLDRALRRIRARNNLILWVDMICINQSDANEKGQQVMLMFDIFNAASTVFAWLGEDPDSDAKDILEDVNPREVETQARREAARVFAGRRYFHRRWIIQELVAALRANESKVLFLYGARSTPWRDFSLLLLSLCNTHSHFTKILRSIDPLFDPTVGTTEGCAIIRQLRNAQDLHCQDDRDRIYALSNLSQGMPVVVDYSLSCAEVYIHFMLSLFFRSSQHEAGALGTEVMALAAYQQASSVAKDRIHALASWMPDWRLNLPVDGWNSYSTTGHNRKGYVDGYNGRHALTVLLVVYAVVYNASGQESADVLTSEGDTLVVPGLQIPPEQVLQEGDILCRPKLDCDFNKNPDDVSLILRPHSSINDAHAIIGRWTRSSLPEGLDGVPKKFIII